MKKIISFIAIFALIFTFFLTTTTFAASLDTLNVESNKTTVRPGEEVNLTINFGEALGAYTFDISYDNNIFDYVTADGGTANNTGNKVRVTFYDTTGGTNPRQNMSIVFKAKEGITTSNPTELTVTGEGLANADASVSYDDITDSVTGSGSFVFVPYAQGITIKEQENVTATPLLTTSDESYARSDISAGGGYAKQEGDIDGPFHAGVKCEKEVEGEISTAVVYGSEYLFTQNADEIVSGTNLMLFAGTLGSFVSYTDSIVVPVKSYEVSYIAMPQSSIVFLALATVIVLPFGFLITGFGIWFKRRKR